MERLSSSHKAKRDLLAEMLYTRSNNAGKLLEVSRRTYAYDALALVRPRVGYRTVSRRTYAYDALGRPTSRTQAYRSKFSPQ